MSVVIEFPCLKCGKEVVNDAIECTLCRAWTHRNCAKLSKAQLYKLSMNDCYWFCLKCKDLFPFTNVPEDEFIIHGICFALILYTYTPKRLHYKHHYIYKMLLRLKLNNLAIISVHFYKHMRFKFFLKHNQRF